MFDVRGADTPRAEVAPWLLLAASTTAAGAVATPGSSRTAAVAFASLVLVQTAVAFMALEVEAPGPVVAAGAMGAIVWVAVHLIDSAPVGAQGVVAVALNVVASSTARRSPQGRRANAGIGVTAAVVTVIALASRHLHR